MAFVTDKEELKPGLIIFRRADVDHARWYCRVKVPKEDRYKTVSLKTDDINTARALAWDQDGEVRYAVKIGHPIFNRPFRDVAKEYLATQEARAKRGEISPERPKKLKAVIGSALDAYVGSTQVHLIGDELWGGYPAWRRENGAGRSKRNGVRKLSPQLADRIAAQDIAAREKARENRGIRLAKPVKAAAALREDAVPFISDSTIRFEMSIFGAVMQYAMKKRYVPASQRFDDRPKLKTMRRDEFTLEEYRLLHTKGRKWITTTYAEDDHEKKHPLPTKTAARWYRTVTYNMVLVACNTGMRPSELKNLRWRDISSAKDRDGRDIVVLFVQGKGKSRKLVAPASVGGYLGRIREQAEVANRRKAGKTKTDSSDKPDSSDEPDTSFAPKPDDRVFTTITGEPTESLYKHLIDDLLTTAALREGPGGTIRSTYSFRHTYATMRLAAGVDVYFLAEQMGTSVKMIEEHYGHVNTIKHADRVLMGIGGWEAMHAELEAEHDETESAAKAAKAISARQKAPPRRVRRAPAKS